MVKTRVMVIDEQSYFRTGVRQILLQDMDFDVLEAEPNNEILTIIENKMPDIVLLGSDLSTHKSLDLGRRIAHNFPNTRVIILSPNTSDEELFNVIRSSAVACLSKNASAAELIGVIKRASRGEYPINETVTTRPTVARQVLREFQDMSPLGDTIAIPLTQRERQILTHVADGNSNKQIAGILDISEQTIKNHVSSILPTLNANDRAHAVVLAIRRGWIPLGETKAEISLS